MRKESIVVMGAFLMSSAMPVFAQTYQEQVICHWSADNSCFNREKTEAVGNGSPEGKETVGDLQEGIRARLHGSEQVAAAAVRGDAGSPVISKTPEQRQEEIRHRLHG
ncbi:hypothetical protein [Geomonas sp.]|uniref:hypothetical protein n=1 Tax=Geomonas sp. TaxID=2651584 RepID=UPI002B48D192|nr:hypothetical protein [Geomonas sp.]HJV34132.1 hypothetical protein [Geomonas sp.]